MEKMKNMFDTPKKAVITIISIIAILAVLIAGTVFISNAIAKNSSIGEEKARKYAFEDAGVDPASAENVRTEFEFEHGHYVYEVEFIADGTEYEYWIKASEGTVLKKETEPVKQRGGSTETVEKISIDKAKEIALADAGLSAEDVTFTKEKSDTEDKVAVYDIEFSTATHEYEYEINAVTGKIRKKDVEAIGRTEENVGNNADPSDYIGVEKAKSIAVDHAGLSVSDVRFSKAKLDKEDGYTVYDIEFDADGMEYDYTINALTGTIMEYDVDLHD